MNMNMNMDQALSAVRWVITTFGGMAAAKGWVSSDQLTTISGLAITLVPLAWSMFVHTDNAKIASAANVPEVSKIVTTPAKSIAIPNLKVVSQ